MESNWKEVVPEKGMQVALQDSPEPAHPLDDPEVYHSKYDIQERQAGLEPNIGSHGSHLDREKPSRRRWVYLVAAVALLAVLGVALGAGLGVGLKHEPARANAASTSPATPAVPETTAPSATTSSGSSKPYSTSASGSSATTDPSYSLRAAMSSVSPTPMPSSTGITSPCPSMDRQVSVQDELSYYLICDSDIVSTVKQTLLSTVVNTLDACIGQCDRMNQLQNQTDIGAVWNFAGTGTQTPGTCWCVSSPGEDFIPYKDVGNIAATPLPKTP